MPRHTAFALVAEIRGGLEWGYALYNYRMSLAQRATAAGILEAACRDHKAGATSALEDAHLEILFCIFSAHQLRDNMGAGLWSWEAVRSALGLDGDDTRWDQKFRRLAEEGLRRTRRELRRSEGGQRLFLGSLVLEGGGPIGLLRDAEAGEPLRRFLRWVLEQAERFQSPAAQHGEAARYMLPTRLQNNEVYSVLTSIVDSVVGLRSTLARDRVPADADPVAHLDASDPRWRERFVLDLEDGVARELLSGLLRRPRPDATRGPQPIVPVIETWLRGADPLALAHKIVLRPEFPARDFLDQLGYLGETPSTVHLKLACANGKHVRVATLERRGGDNTAMLRVTHARLPGGEVSRDDARDGPSLLAVSNDRLLGQVPLGGVDLPPGEP